MLLQKKKMMKNNIKSPQSLANHHHPFHYEHTYTTNDPVLKTMKHSTFSRMMILFCCCFKWDEKRGKRDTMDETHCVIMLKDPLTRATECVSLEIIQIKIFHFIHPSFLFPLLDSVRSSVVFTLTHLISSRLSLDLISGKKHFVFRV